MKRNIELKILDEVYRIQSTSEESHMRKIEAFLNEKLELIKNQAHIRAPHQLYLLASLDIVDDFIKLQDKQQELERERRQLLEDVESVYADIELKLKELDGLSK